MAVSLLLPKPPSLRMATDSDGYRLQASALIDRIGKGLSACDSDAKASSPAA
jgi:hypothetical protein